jgi:hypothetical protein
LPSGEKATELTELTDLEWLSSVCSAAPVTASQSLTVSSREPGTTSLPSGEKATEVTEFEWLWSVYSAAPAIASQSLPALSPEPDSTTSPSGEKPNELTQSEWPSRVYNAAFQFACTFGFVWIQGGIHFSNRPRTMLFSGAKTRPEQYSWRGACPIIYRL